MLINNDRQASSDDKCATQPWPSLQVQRLGSLLTSHQPELLETIWRWSCPSWSKLTQRLISGVSSLKLYVKESSVVWESSFVSRYVFASRELPKYMGQTQNDAFALTVNSQNIAALTNRSPVSINNLGASATNP